MGGIRGGRRAKWRRGARAYRSDDQQKLYKAGRWLTCYVTEASNFEIRARKKLVRRSRSGRPRTAHSETKASVDLTEGYR